MTSFAQDIAPLFREKDVRAMTSMFDLSDYDDVRDNAEAILDTVTAGTMPCDHAWPQDQVATFRSWIEQDCPQ